MTRKDYVLIAAAIAAEHAGSVTFAEQNRVVCVAQRLCIALKQDNPRFDEDRFMKACIGY